MRDNQQAANIDIITYNVNNQIKISIDSYENGQWTAGKKTMKVKIIKSKSEYYWYANRIGEIFEVKKIGENYLLTERLSFFIDKDDCEIIEDSYPWVENKDRTISELVKSLNAKCDCIDRLKTEIEELKDKLNNSVSYFETKLPEIGKTKFISPDKERAENTGYDPGPAPRMFINKTIYDDINEILEKSLNKQKDKKKYNKIKISYKTLGLYNVTGTGHKKSLCPQNNAFCSSECKLYFHGLTKNGKKIKCSYGI